MTNCVNCGKGIEKGENICPSCGSEQPVEWMVKAVYALAFLFVQGVVYRLIWPDAKSVFGYAAYFALTGAAALAVYFHRRKK